MKVTPIIIGLLMCSQTIANSKVYKWTDADGNVHYTDKKPENQSTTEIKVKISQPQASANIHRLKIKPRPEKTNKQKLDTYLQKDIEIRRKANQKRKKCAHAKKELRKFKQSMTYKIKAPGSGKGYAYLNMTQKAAREKRYQRTQKRYQQKINKACR